MGRGEERGRGEGAGGENGPGKKWRHGLRGSAGPTERAIDTSSEATTSKAAAGGSGWALGQKGEPTPP